MELEYLVKTIEESGAEIHNKDIIGDLDEEYNLNRTIRFSIGEDNYKIIWFKNMSNLYIDNNTQLFFDDVACSNTWPVCASEKSKNQLQFKYNGNKVCIVITERY